MQLLLRIFLAVPMTVFFSQPAFSHCDTLDGPVVEAARSALASGNVDEVLIWVQPQNDREIREAFRRTLEVRSQSVSAMELADTYFFETVVRLHRQGEGAPYAGLKPAGTDLGRAIPAADHALASGSIESIEPLLLDAVRDSLHRHYEEASSKRDFDPTDVAAGRDYVTSYVEYIHYVERIYEASTTEVQGHFPEHQ